MNEFLKQFTQTPILAIKRRLVREFFEKNPKVKYKNIVKKISTLTDRLRFVEFAAQAKRDLGFFELFSLSRTRAGIERDIRKKADKIYKHIITKQRGGKKFEQILLGNISPLIKQNDSAVLWTVMDRIQNLPPDSSLKQLYSNLFQDMAFALKLVLKVKNEGTTEKSIEQNLVSNQKKIVKAGMRNIIQNVFFMDPAFGTYFEMIKKILGSFERKDEEISLAPPQSGEIKLKLDELKNIKELNIFLDKADEILSLDSRYLEYISRLFDLLINMPLINIYKTLKFPIDREVFKKWVRNAPVPYRISGQMENQFINLNKEYQLEHAELKPPGNYKDLIKLVYNFNINYTDKYKLLSGVPEQYKNSDAVEYCLKSIKNVQFPTENRFLTSIINQLEHCFSRTEIELKFKNDAQNIEKRISKYKETFKKEISKSIGDYSTGVQKLFALLIKHVEEERIITLDKLFEFDAKINPAQKLGFILKLANYIIGYYLFLNCRLILKWWAKYFKTLKSTDGVFLKNRLSAMTKEEIYEFCVNYASEKSVLIQGLEKYLKWGRDETAIRKKMLAHLGEKNDFTPQIVVGKYRFRISKYGVTYRLLIKDKEDNPKLSKKVSGINIFLDFNHIVKKNKIDNLLNIKEEQLRIIFQNAHLENIAELDKYIAERLEILKIEKLASRYSSKVIKIEYENAEEPNTYLDELFNNGNTELLLREKILGQLESELKQTPREEEVILTRIKKEINSEKALISKLNILLKFMAELRDKHNETDFITVERINKYLAAHRLKDNAEYIDSIKQKINGKSSAEINRVKSYLSKFPQPEILQISNPLYEGKYDKIEQAQADIHDYILSHSIEENINHLQALITPGTEELNLRENYFDKHSSSPKEKPVTLLYKHEMDIQKELFDNTNTLLDYINKELFKLKEIKKVNDAVHNNTGKIKSKIQDLADDKQLEALIGELNQISDTEEKLQATAVFMVSSSVEDIIAKTREIIDKGKKDKYKILSSLCEIIDQNDDYDLKLKILNEFSNYLDSEEPETYLHLKYLLDIQKQKLIKDKEEKHKSISDIWRTLNTLPSPERKIAHLEELLNDDAWGIYHNNIKHMKEMFLTENVDRMIEQNNELALQDQLDIIEKFKVFRARDYAISAINRSLFKKEHELKVRRELLLQPATRIFNKKTLGMMREQPLRELKVLLDMDNNLRECEQEAVKKEFLKQNIPEGESKEHISKNLRPVSPVQRILNLKKIGSQKKALLKQLQSLPEGKMVEKKEWERALQEIDAPQQPKQKTIAKNIENLKQARDFYGQASLPPEIAVIEKIERLVKQNKTTEAAQVIKAEVIAENVKKRQIDKLSRMLTSLQKSEITSRQQEIGSLIKTYTEKTKNIIITNAAKSLRQKQEKETGKELVTKEHTKNLTAKQEANNKVNQKEKKPGIDSFIKEIQYVKDFISPSQIAQARGFKQEDIKQLPNILSQIKYQEQIIYAPVSDTLIGAGRLKGLIEKAHEEKMAGQPITVNMEMVQTFWELVRKKQGLSLQYKLLGVKDKEERNTLFRKLQDIYKDKEVTPENYRRKRMIKPRVIHAFSKRRTPNEEKQKEEKEKAKNKKKKKTIRTGPSIAEKLKASDKKPNNFNYKSVMKGYIKKSYAPIINTYIKTMYKTQEDFYVPIGNNKQYFTFEILKSAIINVLKRDIKGKQHLDLVKSLNKDKDLLANVVKELFIEKKTNKGNYVYFPGCLKSKSKHR